MSQHHRASGWTTAVARTWRTRIDAQLPLPCSVCARLVQRTDAWDVDHIVPVSAGGRHTSANLAPAHRGCNRRAGGRLGAAKTNSAKRTDQRLPAW